MKNFVQQIIQESKLLEISRISNENFSSISFLSQPILNKQLSNLLKSKKLSYYDKIGDINIFTKNSPEGIDFYLEKEKDFVGKFSLEPLNVLGLTVNKVVHAELYHQYKGKGIGKAMYKFLINKFKILSSDNHQTATGAKIWKSFISDKKYQLFVFDTKKNTLTYLSDKINPFTGNKNIHLLACKTIPTKLKKYII